VTFKPALWYPIAAVLSAINVAAVWFAARPGEPLHATAHAALAVAFGWWAHHLKQRTAGSELQAVFEDLEAHEREVGKLRQELSETQERLDFAERLLAQRPESPRVGPQA
jgi:hypothetical protein